MDKRLLDKNWRMSHLYMIRDKQSNKIQFRRNKAQDHFNKNKHSRNILLKSRQLGFCGSPAMRVLTSDLKWIALKDIRIGQEIVCVDEFPEKGRGKGRKMRVGFVQNKCVVNEPAYKLKTDDGREIIFTKTHRLLSKKKGCTDTIWRKIEDFKVGNEVRYITKPWGESDHEDGWFGGILDGEGSMANKNSSAGICAAQVGGDVWERMVSYCRERGYNFRIETDNRKGGDSSKFGDKPVHKICIGRMDEMFRLIGQTRPSRFIKNRFWENRDLPGKKSAIGWSKIISIEYLGEMEMIDLHTSHKTYIAEGFVSHNSTDEALDSLDDALFRKNFSSLIINYEQKEAIRIFQEKIAYAWDNFPDFIKKLYNVNTERANQLVFGFGDGSVSSIAVAQEGRGGTYNRVHITELAKLVRKYPQKASVLIESVMPSVPVTGRIDIESTAEGSDGLFYDMFWEAYNRERKPYSTEFKAHFYNWQWDEDIWNNPIIIPFEDMEQADVFKEYAEKHNLKPEEITYYYLRWLSVTKNWQKMRQEYPTTPEEAFIGSGFKMFDQDKLEALRPTLKNGTQYEDWIFYESYIDGHNYCMGVDVAEGVGQDSSAIIILDVSGKQARVVAEFVSNTIPPDLLAYEVKRGGERYGNAIAGVERNSTGYTTLTILKGIYGNIYTEVVEKKITDRMTENLGWHTNASTKPKMLYELADAIRDGLIGISSKNLFEELRTYDKEDIRTSKFNSTQSRHWDRVMALAIAWQMRSFSYETNEIEIFSL